MHAEFVMISLSLHVLVLCWLLVDYNPQSKRFCMQRFFLRMQLLFYLIFGMQNRWVGIWAAKLMQSFG
jgi:hypothetical protein